MRRGCKRPYATRATREEQNPNPMGQVLGIALAGPIPLTKLAMDLHVLTSQGRGEFTAGAMNQEGLLSI